jgi:DNA replication ATP-dependent helicase Dna2
VALNPEQRLAVAAALRLEPGQVLLVQGPPGTGKTRMIAHLARALAARDFWRAARRPVLVLANTHRACNEVVLRLRREFPDLAPFVVRVGRAGAGWEPEVTQHVLAERLGLRERLRTVDLMADGPAVLHRLARAARVLHAEAAIFVSTLAAAAAPELRGLAFETVIVDECGQATEPATLQALRHLPPGYQGRLVLVGDHRQLPPVVPEGIAPPPVPPELHACGFAPHHSLLVSLFERLATRYPDRLLQLRAQYRMNAAICRLVSETFYAGALRPADERIARRTLRHVYRDIGCAAPHLSGIIARVFAPEPAIVLLDTRDDPLARDTVTAFAADETRRNPREAELVAALLAGWLHSMPRQAACALAAHIGVIAAYRQQNNLIRQALAARLPDWPDVVSAVRVDTVDRFQGSEREVIVLSLVASNAQRSIGRLHADWRRMNVACSRARCKLVLVGDSATFTEPGPPHEEPTKAYYRRLFALCRYRLACDDWHAISGAS